jgi:hypothetical protein
VRHIGVKSIKTIADKRHLNYSIVNIIRGKHLRTLKRPNKSKKYNSNTFKDKDNKAKKLALLGRCPNR